MTLDRVQNVFGVLGDLGFDGELLPVDLDGRRANGAQGLDDLLDAHPGGFVEVAADREGGEHDGEVGFDRITLMMEHWLCRPLGYADLGGVIAGHECGLAWRVGIVDRRDARCLLDAEEASDEYRPQTRARRPARGLG